MRVNPRDGRCRSCGGELVITDADDATMTAIPRSRTNDVVLFDAADRAPQRVPEIGPFPQGRRRLQQDLPRDDRSRNRHRDR